MKERELINGSTRSVMSICAFITTATLVAIALLLVPGGAYLQLIAARTILSEAPLSEALTSTVISAMTRVERISSHTPALLSMLARFYAPEYKLPTVKERHTLAEFIALCLSAPDTALPTLAEKGESFGEIDDSTPAAFRLFLTSLAAIEAEDNKQQSIRKKISILEERKKNLSNEESLVITDITQLFSLPLEGETEDATPFSAPLYEAGILAGLPKIKGVPDSISDLAGLRDSITVAGGEVKITAPDPATEFPKRIEEIKKTLAALTTEHHEISTTLAHFSEEKEESTRELARSINTMKLAGRELLFQIAH